MRKKIIIYIKNWLLAFIYPRPFVGFFYLPKYFYQLFAYSKMNKAEAVRFKNLHPCLLDASVNTPFDAHYFYQGAWLSRKLKLLKINNHFDIGSSVLTIGVLSGFIKTTFIDFRRLEVNISNLESISGNILNLNYEDESLPSLSCLHVIEHIGLGRYGDNLDPFGSIKAAAELQRVLAKNGNLFITVPVGDGRECFNAHRIFSSIKVVEMFSDLELVDFCFVDDEGAFFENAEISNTKNLYYGCGMFHFKKLN